MGEIGAKGEFVIAVPWGRDHQVFQNAEDYTIHKLILYLKLNVA
jgi:hypothetical protein